MKNLLAVLVILCTVWKINAQDLRFHDDGTFKIVQFTDTHIDPMKPESEVAINVIRSTVASEHPDVIVMTGDVVTGKPAAKGWKRVLAVLEETKVPYLLLNGNHDTEQDLSYQEITHFITSARNCLNKANEEGVLADMVLEIKGEQGTSAEALIYGIDSHSNSLLPQVDGYAWINYDQIAWYRSQSNQYKAKNGGKALPSLAFFHIPLAEYTAAFDRREGAFCGIRLERECPADINSGMFGAFLEQGDVMGVFAGHDHDNDYVASYKGIALGYGRFSGGKTTYIDLQPGARVITLYKGKKEFTSYIRLQDGRIIDRFCSNVCPENGSTGDEDALSVSSTAAASEWMKGIDGSTRMCKLSIPATHDSGAMKGGSLLQTQDITLMEQLEEGIRGFDIRLKAEDNQLRVYHGTARQDITWEENILPLYLDFLKSHPSETLIVSVKCEGGSKEAYKNLLARLITDANAKAYFVDEFKAGLTLDECRGKILFIHRDEVMQNYPGVYCYGWQDNVTCSMVIRGSNGQEATVSLQDEYQHKYAGNAPYKMATTLKNMTAAMNETESSDKWFISFASATAFPGDGPKDFADKVNPGLAHEIQELHGNFGIVLIDFAGSPDGRKLVERLIDSNYSRN